MNPKPKAVFWYQIYCGTLAAVYLVVAAAGAVLLALPAASLEMQEAEKFITAGICLAVSLPLLAASLLPFCFHPRPWLWVYGIVLIAVGFTSCCFWPICIPLLVYWLKPDVQGYFGRNAGTGG